ncbi:hypothetical protein SELMODRAFT_108260 [Selaginella moellendorffii]|uniref:Fumarylacetoacetase-like C-terminal domain-containing protein n=1 Tax=Selaginella moellendorffii TaxID=88036 RepID=D8S3P7_SELML|nr:probable acylpyruvase FAHD1, mitochondrial [Selaginella moellendorffii]EFJ20795.1 hypothetical protein SELMODRAFT_108260 [Selaginella moellendorffii]|eukprot:XP_002978138.1 probable acylpyruvase FAHD1, mitochondrial [Selaginella moellendorffii]
MSAELLGRKLIDCGTKIVAVGRNYAAHAKELGSAIPKEPVLFLKPTSSYVREPDPIEIPKPITEVDYEAEIGVVIGRRAKDVFEEEAWNYVRGYVLALDMTARSLQNVAKEKRLPWTVSKGYDTFTPISKFFQLKKTPIPPLSFWLKVDGQTKQKGCTSDMIFSIPFLIHYISGIMTLNEGDMILTGTPHGVGPVKAGQTITAGIASPAVQMTFPVITRPDPERTKSPFLSESLDGTDVPQ